MLHLLHNTILMITNMAIPFSSNPPKPTLLPMRINYKLMCSMIQVYILSINHDVICVAEQLRHFFKGYAFCFRQNKGEDDSSEARDDYEDLRDVLKGCLYFETWI